MTGNQVSDAPTGELSRGGEVAHYLRRHPEFFEQHPELLTELGIPHRSGRAVSLIERQVDTLRSEVKQYRQQIKHLVALARENERLSQRLHKLTLALIEAADFTEVLNTLEDHLHDDFQADAVELRLFSVTALQDAGKGSERDAPDPVQTAFSDFCQQGRPLCGPVTERQLSYLFGSQAEDVRSTALLPLKGDDLLGVLAIGSADPQRFHPDMGTEFLVRLAETVSRKLQVVSLPGV
jgi:uncharacterized protein YigA (DUF484 family)